jgi:hypothetical protein
MTDDANFEPCILVKVRNDQFEVMDVNDDTKLEDDLDWKGDDELENNWNMYCKYPLEDFVQSYRRDLELVKDTQEARGVKDYAREQLRIWLRRVPLLRKRYWRRVLNWL